MGQLRVSDNLKKTQILTLLNFKRILVWIIRVPFLFNKAEIFMFFFSRIVLFAMKNKYFAFAEYNRLVKPDRV